MAALRHFLRTQKYIWSCLIPVEYTCTNLERRLSTLGLRACISLELHLRLNLR
uniref:Uncharacterized protein n=1 Tax=Rhizophora mucronata TaxID=61149 RepID=A0A2P2P4R5_RHIMU